ncbi:MAG: DinB family protein [Bacteroidota bacterium]
MRLRDLQPAEYDPYYHRYLAKLPGETTLREGYRDGQLAVCRFFRALPPDVLDRRYEPAAWSVREVLQHLIDTERIFAYRTFRIARRDQTPLADFDQTGYMAPSGATGKSRTALLREFEAVRTQTIVLLDSLSDDDLRTVGISSGQPMSARAAAFVVIGHDRWHLDLINERYL